MASLELITNLRLIEGSVRTSVPSATELPLGYMCFGIVNARASIWGNYDGTVHDLVDEGTVKVEIVQVTGQSTTAVISQKGTTDAINTAKQAVIDMLGTAASKDVGTAAGNVPVLGSDGKLDQNVLPSIAITETFVVASEVDMLKLNAQVGDVAVRTDVNKSFILQKSPATTAANWVELLASDCNVESDMEYGVRWTKGASSPTCERVTRYKGAISTWDISYTPNVGAVNDNPFDYIDLFSPQKFVDVHGNVFARFKRFYVAKQTLGTYEYIWVCRKKLYSFYNLPKAFYRNGQPYWNYVDIGCYEASDEMIDGAGYLASKSGQIPSHNYGRTEFFNNAKAWNNMLESVTGEYYLISTLSEITEILQPLFTIMTGTKNSQSIYRGVVNHNTAAINVSGTSGAKCYFSAERTEFAKGYCVCANGSTNNNQYYKVISTGTDGTGFYVELDRTPSVSVTSLAVRPNFTGDTDDIIATSGSASNEGKSSFKVFTIENIYGNTWRQILDLTIKDYVPYICQNLENWTNTSTPETDSNFIRCSYKLPEAPNSYIKEVGFDAENHDAILPVEVGGSSSTYYCDNLQLYDGARTAYFGGYLSSGDAGGLWCWYLSNRMNISYWTLGARLSHRSL